MATTFHLSNTSAVINGDVIGSIQFDAPNEDSGLGANEVCAGIEAVAEGEFTTNSNATKLSFKTGASEAATEKMSLSSGGNLTIGNLTLANGSITDSSGAISFGSNTLTTNGALTAGTLTLGSTLVTSTAAELNILEGVTATAAELNLLDGLTVAEPTTIVDTDRIIINDDGAMKQCAVTDLKTYIGSVTGKVEGTYFTGSLLVGHSTTGDLEELDAATYNTGVGIDAMNSITTGDNNTCIGYNSGTAMTSSTGNTIIGASSGTAISGTSGTSNTNNTIIGYDAGNSLDSSSTDQATENVIIGTKAGNSGTNNLATGSNCIIIGYNANSSAADVNDEITLGISSVTSLRCADTTIASLSDRRDKTDIIDSTYGTDFINTLRPVQFTWATREKVATKDGKKRVGFIAQDLQEAMPNGENDILDLVYDVNPERIEAKYGNLVPILTKAIQELSAANTALLARVVALESA